MGTRNVIHATILGQGARFLLQHTNGINTEMYTWNQSLAVGLGQISGMITTGDQDILSITVFWLKAKDVTS